MIVEKKNSNKPSKFYAYISCLPGGDGVFVDVEGKISIFKAHGIRVVSGIELMELQEFVRQREKSGVSRYAEKAVERPKSSTLGHPYF